MVITARYLMFFCALSALIAFFMSLGNVQSAELSQKAVELWRMFGFLLFAGLFLLLGLKLDQYPGIWELTIFHKLTMTVSALFLWLVHGATDAWFIALIDGLLTVLLILSYVFTKAYTAWRSMRNV